MKLRVTRDEDDIDDDLDFVGSYDIEDDFVGGLIKINSDFFTEIDEASIGDVMISNRNGDSKIIVNSEGIFIIGKVSFMTPEQYEGQVRRDNG